MLPHPQPLLLPPLIDAMATAAAANNTANLPPLLLVPLLLRLPICHCYCRSVLLLLPLLLRLDPELLHHLAADDVLLQNAFQHLGRAAVVVDLHGAE